MPAAAAVIELRTKNVRRLSSATWSPPLPGPQHRYEFDAAGRPDHEDVVTDGESGDVKREHCS
jgi:hypothetical protein